MSNKFLAFRGYFCNRIIEVSKTADIPKDYYGVMGVPITFMDKYCPEQFEILEEPKHEVLRPSISGQTLYTRIPIRRKLPPEIEQYINKEGWFHRIGDDLFVPLLEEDSQI